MQISCHFQDYETLLVLSLTHVSSAVEVSYIYLYLNGGTQRGVALAAEVAPDMLRHMCLWHRPCRWRYLSLDVPLYPTVLVTIDT